jgi:hypothetical protein
MNIEPSQKVSNYTEIQPVMLAMKANNDKLPKNSLPVSTNGTIQSNVKPLPPVTLYNSHGILTKTNPNSLIGFA